ncbi:MAG: YbaB/EbfC family nucleoid-associated protein [Synergistaceae bacterium]|nr:YbaB/EbfC family nucleoid-associated protein [Synergistaceae bacterium]
MKINNDMLKMVKKMQDQAMQIQEKLGDEMVEGESGGGMVKVTFTGHGDLVELKIDPEIIKPEDAGLLEDLILVAVNNGIQKSRELASSSMPSFDMGSIANSLGMRF